jgi:hypothetical protein
MKTTKRNKRAVRRTTLKSERPETGKINRFKILFREDKLGGKIIDLDTGEPVERVSRVVIVLDATQIPKIEITYHKSAKGKNFFINGTVRKK